MTSTFIHIALSLHITVSHSVYDSELADFEHFDIRNLKLSNFLYKQSTSINQTHEIKL